MKFINDNSISKHKIKRRYRLSFQSENTLNELWSVKLTRGKVFIALAVIIAAITTLISTIIVSTPLRTFLPGYLKSEQRTENIVNAFRLDSLEKAVAANEAYISNIRNIITGNIPDTSVRDTSTVHYPTDSLIPQSQREKEFISQYDERASTCRCSHLSQPKGWCLPLRFKEKSPRRTRMPPQSTSLRLAMRRCVQSTTAL